MAVGALRPELKPSNDPNLTLLPRATAYWMILDSVERRTGLIAGALHKDGAHCALGSFYADNPKLTVPWSVVDEVSAVNDSVKGTPRARWLKVRSWLRWKKRVLAQGNG